ncbi:MAG TPA: F0F1 ATP synthase subunit epsilon [Bacteroidota bacterium]|nr:F0F1 ATP synthase subunit epsilon [Bacteroidota bacterium]
MYEKSFQLDIVAPDKVVFRGEATSVTAPGVLGSFQVLYNHAPLLSQLTPGQVTVRGITGDETLYAVGGGFAEVRNNHVVILTDSAEQADDIDVERAENARDVADDVLRARAPGENLEEAQAALARAVSRLKIARKLKQ